MENKNFFITKASGERVPFAQEKFRKSLKRAGADDLIIDKILEEIEHQFYPGINTKKIYQIAFSMLKRFKKPVAARYKLKMGIMELGPSGFPFEKFISEVLKIKGFHPEVNKILEGRCVFHEVDILAKKDSEIFIIECKFHNRPGYNCDVKTPLYVHSRYMDLVEKQSQFPEYHKINFSGWLITNTRFTADAVKYGLCCGLKLLAWDYPKTDSLRAWIEMAGLYPLTCLTTLSRIEKQRLLDKKVVLCRELLNNVNLLKELDVREPRLKKVLAETYELCKSNINGD